MMIKMSNIRGFSLIELLVGMAVSLIVTAVAIAGFSAVARSSQISVQGNRLNQDLQIISGLISNELRRAGFDGDLTDKTDLFLDIYIPPAGNCILFSYDRVDASGDPLPDGIPQNSERLGFKLDSGVIKSKKSGVDGNNCTTGTWESLTDDSGVVIDELTFDLVDACVNATAVPDVVVADGGCAALSPAPATGDVRAESRRVSITIRGHLANDPETVKQVTTVAKLRNNRVFK